MAPAIGITVVTASSSVLPLQYTVDPVFSVFWRLRHATGVHDVCKPITLSLGCQGASLFLCCSGADSMLTVAVYEMVGILPTDPGYGYYRDHVQMFDPGWKGYQAKGPEDWNFDVFDKGNDPEGVLHRCPSTC